MDESKIINKITYDKKEGTLNTCRVSKLPFNVWWQGSQRPLDQTEEAYFCSVYGKNSTVIEIEYKERVENLTVRPIGKGVKYEIDGKKVRFTLEKFGQYVVERGDEHNALHLFFNEEKEFDLSKYNIVFNKGEHNVGKITLKSGDRVYIDRNAVVNGCFYGENISDVTISGYGIICDKKEERVSSHCYENYTNGCLKFIKSKNINIEGVVLVDSAIWVVNIFDCENVTVNNVKIVGQWRYNTDGIDIVNSRNITVKNSFIRSFDDSITLKGIVHYREKDEKNIFVENCVCWCGWGRTLEIGLETVADNFENITFRNCDLIHNSAVAIDVQAGDYANIKNLTFEDIRVEYSEYALPEVVQFPSEKEYDGYGVHHVPILIAILSADYTLSDPDYQWYHNALKESRVGKKGVIDNVVIKNVKAIGKTVDNVKPKITVSVKDRYFIDTVRIENVEIFGKKIENIKELNPEGESANAIKYVK